MSRSLTIRQPNAAETRRLQSALEDSPDKHVRRRAEVILFYVAGLNALEIAQTLDVHPNTVYADLHAFDQHGLACLQPSPVGGAPRRLTAKQLSEIWRLAERAPVEFGLPYGRWSLANFRDFLIKKRRLLKQISREHVWRVLKKKHPLSSRPAQTAQSRPAAPRDFSPNSLGF